MRAIIIQDADAQSLLRDLELQKMRTNNIGSMMLTNPQKPEGWTDEVWRKSVVDDLHRAFHFVVTRWLQDQGCDCVRRS